MLELIGDWWFPALGYGTMALVVAETVGEANQVARVRRKIRWISNTLQNLLNAAPGERDRVDTLVRRIDQLEREAVQFNETRVTKAEEGMLLWYSVAPLLGLMFTTMQLAMALPGAFDVIQTDPSAFFRSVGVAVGTTAMGVLATVIALVSALGLESDNGAMRRSLKMLEALR